MIKVLKKLELATSYLPRRWPAKYCYRYESLRPCSGWERVESSRLVTSNAIQLPKAIKLHCVQRKLHKDYKQSVIIMYCKDATIGKALVRLVSVD